MEPLKISYPKDPEITGQLEHLIKSCGGNPDEYAGQLILQMLQSTLQLIPEKHKLLQLKLMTRAMKEMRYGYRVFNKYAELRRVSIFGSARTPETHPDYLVAKEFGIKMGSMNWMCMTGAANGIMKAGLEGQNKENSFGLSIRLPCENTSNSLIEGDPKHIVFRYFFTRKLMFLSHSDALAAFPGGVGTMDELFEALTLMQTGKAHIVPVVLLEGGDGSYWKTWEDFFKVELLDKHWVSPEDLSFYYRAPSVEAAVAHIIKFYSIYHSSRYVDERLVMRLSQPVTVERVQQLNEQFRDLIVDGQILISPALPEEEGEYPELSRLVFKHTRRSFGRLRQLIDAINA